MPHPRLFGNVNSVGRQVHLGCASVYLPSTSSTLHRSCTRCPSCNFRSSPPRPGASTTRLRLVVLAPGLGGLDPESVMSTSCSFSQVHLIQVQVPLGFASWYLHLALVDLIQSQWWGTSCNSNSSTPASFKYYSALPRST